MEQLTEKSCFSEKASFRDKICAFKKFPSKISNSVLRKECFCFCYQGHKIVSKFGEQALMQQKFINISQVPVSGIVLYQGHQKLNIFPKFGQVLWDEQFLPNLIPSLLLYDCFSAKICSVVHIFVYGKHLWLNDEGDG